uniref:BPI1 domain-containing protein n=1 Tax=Heterorhabditis bacteriophora TaxID=37862 RepID=A0A1I7WDX5_HETBA
MLIRIIIALSLAVLGNAQSLASYYFLCFGVSMISGSNLNVTVMSIFRLDTPQGEINGNVPLSFDRTNVELLLWTGVNSDGHLKTDLVTCKVAANNIQLQFGTSDTALLSNYLPHINHFIKERIEQAICPTFHAELVPVVSNRLMNTPMSAALFDQYFLNYGLLGPVEFSDDGVLLKHRGNAFGILRQGKFDSSFVITLMKNFYLLVGQKITIALISEINGRTRLNDFRLPFRSPPLSVDGPHSGKMVDFYLSNYTLSSLLFWMDQYRTSDMRLLCGERAIVNWECGETRSVNTSYLEYVEYDKCNSYENLSEIRSVMTVIFFVFLFCYKFLSVKI